MAIVSVPKILRAKLGDDGAEALIQFFNEAQNANSQKEEIIEIVEEKFERRLSEELVKLRVEMTEMKSELSNEMANIRADVIKWMFIFWVGQIGVFVGILLVFFNK